MSVASLPDVSAECAGTIRRHFGSHGDASAAGGVHRTLSVAGLTADDAAQLRALRERLVAGGTPPRAATKYLAGWFGGQVTAAVGRVLVERDAYLLVDPEALLWHLHPGGWPDAVELAAVPVAVDRDHPWAGMPATTTLPDRAALRRRTVDTLADALAPLADAFRRVGGLGRGAFWAEVADGLGNAVAHQGVLDVSRDRVDALGDLVATTGAPWKAKPAIWIADAPEGEVCILRKGGCCLAYTEPPAANDVDAGNEQRLFEERFPDPPARRYCVDCRHRQPGDCAARQLWWAAPSLR